MKALVTGAGGFLGLHLATLLHSEGVQVRGMVRRGLPQLASLGVELMLGDIRDPRAVEAACRGMDTVFHVAGAAGIWGPWEHFHSINTVGTRHIVAACQAAGVRRLIYTSSPSVTFSGSPQEGVDESVPYATRWNCHYPHSKALAEQCVLEADGRGGLATCALRPHLIWGSGDRHLMPRLLQRARSGRLRRIGDGTNLIDMIHVENAALAHWEAAQRLEAGSSLCGRAYFLSQGTPVNCWTWINALLALADLPPVTRGLPYRFATTLGGICEAVYRAAGVMREPPMTRFLAAQLALSHYFDISAARRDLGYRAGVSTEEGMQRLGEELRRGH